MWAGHSVVSMNFGVRHSLLRFRLTGLRRIYVRMFRGVGGNIAVDIRVAKLKTHFLVQLTCSLSRAARGEIDRLRATFGRQPQSSLRKRFTDTTTPRVGIYNDIFDPRSHRCWNAKDDKRKRPDDLTSVLTIASHQHGVARRRNHLRQGIPVENYGGRRKLGNQPTKCGDELFRCFCRNRYFD
jgi:hypothetical protein